MSETHISGKQVLIDRQPAVLYSALSDLSALVEKIPADKRTAITATADTISASVQGFNLGMRVAERNPFSRVTFCQMDGTPIDFRIQACFDTVDVPDKPDADCMTRFHLELDAQLNGMLKIMLGNKLQGLLDNLTDTIAAAAEGRTPDMTMSSFI
ncbi:MAG: hypothetical protein J6X89_02645 [Bacteroidales bacterium]|nr:hypothetical protein [Bacteroidales bacterium]